MDASLREKQISLFVTGSLPVARLMFQRIRAEHRNYLAHSTSNIAPRTITKDTGEFIHQERRNLRSTAEFLFIHFPKFISLSRYSPYKFVSSSSTPKCFITTWKRFVIICMLEWHFLKSIPFDRALVKNKRSYRALCG